MIGVQDAKWGKSDPAAGPMKSDSVMWPMCSESATSSKPEQVGRLVPAATETHVTESGETQPGKTSGNGSAKAKSRGARETAKEKGSPGRFPRSPRSENSKIPVIKAHMSKRAIGSLGKTV